MSEGEGTRMVSSGQYTMLAPMLLLQLHSHLIDGRSDVMSSTVWG